MHKIFYKNEEIELDTLSYRKKMIELKVLGVANSAQIYIDPNLVESDEEYMYLISLRDNNTEQLKKIGNRFEIDEYFKILFLLEELKYNK